MRHLVLLVGLLPAFASASECLFTAQHDFDVDPAGLKTVAFVLGSSDAVVEGVPGLAKIEVRGKACASDQEWLADLGVDQQRSGDRVTITPRQHRNNSWSWLGSSYATVDLRVRVPQSMLIDIKGGSGDTEVRHVAALNIDSGSGDLDVEQIEGMLTAELGSGDVQGHGIGSLDLRRGASGDLRLRDIRGDVKVAHSGSGNLQFDKVGGSVEIGSVGSGDVTARDVNRDVSVDSIGSGDIDVSNVGGNFTVQSIGSGDVDHHDVHGKVSLPRDHD